MKLDSEEQRQTLINCIHNASLSGPVIELMPILIGIAKTLECVKSAEIETKPPEENKNAGIV
jgi:hypothetical protein